MRKGAVMRRRASWMLLPVLLGALTAFALRPPVADSACCYFAAKDKDVQQPAQKVFLTWDPVEKVESFTVQPKFEGNAPVTIDIPPLPEKAAKNLTVGAQIETAKLFIIPRLGDQYLMLTLKDVSITGVQFGS